MRFIDENAARTDGGLRWGVEPICTVLSEHGLRIAPATYYAAKTRPASPRRLRDEQLKGQLAELHAANYGVYGVRKMHAALARNGVEIGRDQTGRLMRELRPAGVREAVRAAGIAFSRDRLSDLLEKGHGVVEVRRGRPQIPSIG